jgi:hypothetical protein
VDDGALLGFTSNVLTSVTSGRLYFDSLVAKPQSRLYYAADQTFNVVTDRKSSSILIYKVKGAVIHTGINDNDSNENVRKLLLKWGIFNKRENLIN